jgi:hypothetical protein
MGVGEHRKIAMQSARRTLDLKKVGSLTNIPSLYLNLTQIVNDV